MTMNISVRRALSSDFDLVGRVFAEENRFHAALLPERFQIAEPIMTRDWFTEIITHPQKALLVAENEHEIVGVLLIVIQANPDDPIFQPRRYGYVEEVAVAERYRGQGIGQRLMQKAHHWAVEQGMQEIELHVWENNQPAIVNSHRVNYSSLDAEKKVQALKQLELLLEKIQREHPEAVYRSSYEISQLYRGEIVI